MDSLRTKIEAVWADRGLLDDPQYPEAVLEVVRLLDIGELRVATPPEDPAGPWTVHAWIKQAVLLFFGALGLGVAPLSLPVSLIGSMALGIAIDDTVHYLVRYRRERQAGADPEEAAGRATRRVGRPIAITSVMLFFGFLLVTVSPFATIAQFGALAAFTMAVCLTTDLMLLPALLVRLRI